MVIVSGGQTGVDRAALDAARQVGLPRAGWCPRGRWAEDGVIPATYPLVETPDAAPAQRTAWNVRDSNATLVLVEDALLGGTALTVQYALAWRRPCALVTLGLPDAPAIITEWLGRLRPVRLNIAGPRESEQPGVYARSHALLTQVLTLVKVALR
ncbi:MAG: putative molybdenum carrier protein [Chloracidobacterium sp.]|uniref:Molybdenum carrier protein n=1 Tax=Chloracidobacterium validum TaxID=2821543 RepID=A0ABX8BDQ5_9BACT|nr:putative molybdenum carrier protein [Chloracidobacterium validum]QUW03778.1 putative molybdenum carrier protein [Chloracidobacterium validum]